MPTFPQDRQAGKQSSAVLYLESGCKNLAPITDVNGKAIPKSTIAASGGLWPFYVSPATALYYRDAANVVVTVLPSIGSSTAQIVTGSKTTGAAVTSLIAALNALGIPLTDSTT